MEEEEERHFWTFLASSPSLRIPPPPSTSRVISRFRWLVLQQLPAPAVPTISVVAAKKVFFFLSPGARRRENDVAFAGGLEAGGK